MTFRALRVVGRLRGRGSWRGLLGRLRSSRRRGGWRRLGNDFQWEGGGYEYGRGNDRGNDRGNVARPWLDVYYLLPLSDAFKQFVVI